MEPSTAKTRSSSSRSRTFIWTRRTDPSSRFQSGVFPQGLNETGQCPARFSPFSSFARGGIAMRQILAAYCALGAFTILLANLALLASVMCRRTATAAAFTALMLFLAFVALPFVRWTVLMPFQFGILGAPGKL